MQPLYAHTPAQPGGRYHLLDKHLDAVADALVDALGTRLSAELTRVLAPKAVAAYPHIATA